MHNLETTKLTYKTVIDRSPYPGYPTTRLAMDTSDIPTLPDGPWQVKQDKLPSIIETDSLARQGLDIDDIGRPLHPWLKDMLGNPEIGAVTGKGYYYNWGPNYTADPIVITSQPQPKILLVQRRDNGMWALPGGFIDPGETALLAAIRETYEETGVTIDAADGKVVYSGPVADQRSTAHAWADTTAVLWRPEVQQTSRLSHESNAVNWFDLRDVRSMILHGSHQKLIEKAIIDHGTMNDIIEYFGPDSEISRPSGGHMAYDRLIVQSPAGNIFVKKHDATRFTDDKREEHSRKYLVKEKAMYDHLQRYDYQHIPDKAEIVSDHSLMLSAYLEQDGWHWRIPNDDTLHGQYINDILSALDDLAALPVLEFNEINDSLDSFVREGWQSLDNKSLEMIRSKLADYSTRVDSAIFARTARKLSNELTKLKEQSDDIDLEQPMTAAHNDFRQSNMAWHPDEGVRIVDWSWAGRGLPGADKTTFLIDMHKHGYDIKKYSDQINSDHILMLIGFWLMHSLEPTCDRTDSVRFQQIHSAVAAYDLLETNL